MIATDPSCLTDEQLRDVAAGRLPTHRFTRLLEHLESCSECQNRAEAALESEDSLVVALAIPSASDPLAAEAECVAALHRASLNRDAPAASSTPPIDRLGPYQLLRPLGSGGMGAVFLAEHTRLRRRCAIKLLPRDRGFDAAWRDRFDREMAAIAALDHPHVVSASDAGEAAGWHFLVMEYLDGLDLSRLAARLGRLEIADACELVRQAAVGLAHIHASGLIHRDIKPSNLMLTRNGIVKILDLGLVLSGTDPLPSEDRMTTVGQLMGTLAYMAPEQLVDSSMVDIRSDLYALGATLYRLLAGVAPHADARGLAPLVIAKTGKGAPAITDHRSDLPAPLAELVTRLLDPNPDGRPQTALEVAEALKPFARPARPDRLVATALRRPAADEESAAAAPVLAQVASLRQPPPRRRLGIIAAAAALPLLLLAGIVIIVQTDRGQLVIESDQPGLTVAVEQGEELVEQLQLETGENRVTLRSGTYTVTLDTPADGLRLSDNTAAITRGGETILKVRREKNSEVSTERPLAAQAQPLYQGKTLDEWLAVLEIDRDVDTVIEAMRAAVALTRDEGIARTAAASGDEEARRTASAILHAARLFGGMFLGDEESPPSERFMAAFLDVYQALTPHVGIEEISEELAAGNRSSAMAAIWMLRNYVTQLGTNAVYEVEPNVLERWSDSEAGRDTLRTLSANLDQAVERLGGYSLAAEGSAANRAVAMAYQIRLQIDALLGRSSLDDPLTGNRLRSNIQKAVDYHQRLFREADESLAQRSTSAESHRLLELEIEAARAKIDPVTLAWAAIPHLLTTEFTASEEPLAFFGELAAGAPTAAADAIVATVYRDLHESYTGSRMVMAAAGTKLPHFARHNSELWQSALEHAARLTSRPQFAHLLFLNLKENFVSRRVQPAEAETPEKLIDALNSAIKQLEERTPASAPDPTAAADVGHLSSPDPKYIQYAERLISHTDENADGVLTVDEWMTMLRDVSPADADGDGRLTVAEYARWLQAEATPQ